METYIVRNKLIITATLAIIGSILALVGGDIRNPVTIVGLLIVATSPITSFIVVYLWYSKRLREHKVKRVAGGG